METVALPPVNLNISHGSFIGNLLTAVCFGVLTIQTSSYYRCLSNRQKAGETVFIWVVCQKLPQSFGTTPGDVGIHNLSNQCNLRIRTLVQVLVLIQFGFGITNAIRSNMTPEFDVMTHKIMWSIVSWLTIQAIADVVIATCMCLLLRRRRTGFQKTDSVITRMILYTMATGLVTSVFSCIDLALSNTILFIFYPWTGSIPSPCLPICTCERNSGRRSIPQAPLNSSAPRSNRGSGGMRGMTKIQRSSRLQGYISPERWRGMM
ncbi:hypothetical protein BS47DRAFT_670593 [Hydnum rufescens UP504]|uniref:DUF6534 domain-containing protein n=1 Tax=Hydnum rufescens UP504 TaxID=1448309 RepID=A0A9P6AEP9_9AGAM|nr:hypothetical protein BS47DRAFT_670593 [Hydnum rufescens UP504]